MEIGMESVLSAKDKADYTAEAAKFNRTINDGKLPKQTLGQDDFLTLLMKELQYQDPTSPMDNKEFIAQMAQFSSLQQMTSMSESVTKLTALLSGREVSAEALSSLGKNVEIKDGDNVVQGMVQAVTRSETPEVLVNGVRYPWEKVTQVFVE